MVRFEKASTLALSDKQQAVLTKEPTTDEVSWDKDRGLAYMGHSAIRQRLNYAFGVGGWCLVPVDNPKYDEGLVLSTWDLYVQGCFVARASGECKWVATNKMMTKGDAIEGSKSNALMRCGKDLGIGIQLWHKGFADKFKPGYVAAKPAEAAVVATEPLQPVDEKLAENTVLTYSGIACEAESVDILKSLWAELLQDAVIVNSGGLKSPYLAKIKSVFTKRREDLDTSDKLMKPR